MARTVKPLHLRFRDNWTGEMRALLSVRNELPFADAHEQACICRARIMKKFRSSHRELIHAGDVLKRRLAARSTQSAQEHNPGLPNHKGAARDDHKLGEITARAIVVLG